MLLLLPSFSDYCNSSNDRASCLELQHTFSNENISWPNTKAGQTLFTKSSEIQFPKPLASVLGTLWRAVTFKSPLLHWLSHFLIYYYLLSSLKVKTKEYAMHPHHFAVGCVKVTMNWGRSPYRSQGCSQGLAKDIYNRVWSLSAAAITTVIPGHLQGITFCIFSSLAPSMCMLSVLTPYL